MPVREDKRGRLRDIVFRSRLLLEGRLIESLRTNEKISINDLLRKSGENPLYITFVADVEGTSIRAHIYGYNNEVLDCFLDNNPHIKPDECLNLLSDLITDTRITKKISIHAFPLDLIRDLLESIEEESRTVSRAEKSERAPVETGLIIEEKVLDYPYIEYMLTNELIKMGLVVESVTITELNKDIVVNIRLSDISELPSPIDVAYVTGGIICENAPLKGNIVVNIVHRKKHKIILNYNGDRIRCIALGVIPRMLKDYGLILRKISYQEAGDLFVLKLGLKQYASEVEHSPMEVVRRIQSMLISILGRKVDVSIKYGLFGKEYRSH